MNCLALLPEVVPAAILLAATILDYLLGDPWSWPHPVQMMGWIITRYTQFIFNRGMNPENPAWALPLRVAGILLAIGLITGSAIVSWLIVQAASWIHPVLGLVVETVLLASCFAGRSLRDAAEDVLQPFNQGDLVKARQQLSLYVGRDTENLPPSEILRAVLETVAENAVDGVTAPLFYALVGLIMTDLLIESRAGQLIQYNSAYYLMAPLAIAYKASSTLDSMVGYQEIPYKDLGWFSAKLDDFLTWLPCRLTVVSVAFLSGPSLYVWTLCQRDGIKDPSPNSGWSECAYAAALGVQLGGANTYRGIVKHKPLLGDPLSPITPEKIVQALQLTRSCFLLGLGLYFVFFIVYIDCKAGMGHGI